MAGRLIWMVFLLALNVGLAGCTARLAPSAAIDDFGTVRDFSLVDQNGREVCKNALLGKVWVASFFFSRCNTVCPQVSATMARLQEELKEVHDVMLVSFSVDPDYDKEAILKLYAQRFKADDRRWLFLTGNKERLYALVRDSFHLGVQANEGAARTPGSEVTHSTRLAIVDGQGHIRAYVDGRQIDDEGRRSTSVSQVRQVVAQLIQEGRDGRQ
jgi:protein SCO1/2